MIKRELEQYIKKNKQNYPVVLITGPRQSGKTTLSKSLFKSHKYYNLEDPSVLAQIINDPKDYVNPSSEPTIFDEVHRYPELLSYIQVAVDESSMANQFILTGSQNLLLSDKVSQSLAGRVEIFKLLPFSIRELKESNLLEADVYKNIFYGGYPRIYESKLDPNRFYANYVSTYVERDVRNIKNVGNILDFQRFMQLLAGRVGQVFNAASIANDIGITTKTAQSWISILEQTYIVFSLTPYYKNWGKRIIKSPKIYFYDSGLLSYLLGINNIQEYSVHYARGSVFKNYIISELIKNKYNNGYKFNEYYWRDSNGNEIDLLLDRGSTIDIIEIKSSSTYKSEFKKFINYWNSVQNDLEGKKYIIYRGETNNSSSNLNLINWSNLELIE